MNFFNSNPDAILGQKLETLRKSTDELVSLYNLISELAQNDLRNIKTDNELLSQNKNKALTLSNQININLYELENMPNVNLDQMQNIRLIKNKFTAVNVKLIELCKYKSESTQNNLDNGLSNKNKIQVPIQNLSQQNQYQSQYQQQQPLPQVNLQDQFILIRNQEIANIQKNTMEVNQLMKDVLILVEDSGDMIDNIETNIIRAFDDVQIANNELEIYEDKQKCKRECICYFGISIFVIILLLLVIVIISTNGRE